MVMMVPLPPCFPLVMWTILLLLWETTGNFPEIADDAWNELGSSSLISCGGKARILLLWTTGLAEAWNEELDSSPFLCFILCGGFALFMSFMSSRVTSPYGSINSKGWITYVLGSFLVTIFLPAVWF